MQPANHRRLLEMLRGGWQDTSAPVVVTAARYRDASWFAREQQVVRGLPRVVAASTAVAPGRCVTVDPAGVIVVRDHAGTVRAFANSCRHRATRLVEAPCAVKALVCPYHGWTYDLTGTLIHLPHAEAFAGCEHRDLRAVPVAERHGLIWLGDPAPPGVAGGAAEPAARQRAFDSELDELVGELAGDLDAIGLQVMAPWSSSRVTRACNWKLVVEAFLDGYHLRQLHRDSIYRFFVDAGSIAERVGPHVRAVSSRRALRDALPDLGDERDLHALGTPSFVLFPGTIVICHPDFVSVITLAPVAADSTIVEHTMLVPVSRVDEREHWDRSWALIDGGVIQREDLWVCEQVQRGLDDELVFGSLEAPIGWFHDALDRALAHAR